ncbi:MAG: hypothetical protein ACI9H8_000565 [Lysobacterales bacterium]|jgi:hypothetical protein
MQTATMKIGLMVVGLISLAACSSTVAVKVEGQFPNVVAEPKNISAALVFDQDFRNYIATPNENTSIDIGSSQIDLLERAFKGLFQTVEVVSSKELIGPETDLVIIPSVRQVQLSTPSDSYLNVYEVWIKYNLDIETAEGEPIESWFMPAYGKTPDSMMLSRANAITSATTVALRDAGAKLLLDFYRIPSVYGWIQSRLEQEQQQEQESESE